MPVSANVQTTGAAATIYEVPLEDGTSWTGTMAKLRQQHPSWVQYARPIEQEEEEEDENDRRGVWATRPPTSTRSYDPARYQVHPDQVVNMTPRASARSNPPRQQQRNTTQEPTRISTTSFKEHAREFFKKLLIVLGIVLIIMVAGWYGLNALGDWWRIHQDDTTYGRPRTFQVDVNVGHGTSSQPLSHFIAQNLNRQIIVFEIPGDDPRKSEMYLGPKLYGDGQDLTPVTLTFSDVNGSGKLAMIIHVLENSYIFLNTGPGFKAAPNQ